MLLPALREPPDGEAPPKGVVLSRGAIVDSLPRNAMGKVRKTRLRAG
jgi:hypothetical protein